MRPLVLPPGIGAFAAFAPGGFENTVCNSPRPSAHFNVLRFDRDDIERIGLASTARRGRGSGLDDERFMPECAAAELPLAGATEMQMASEQYITLAG